MMQNKESSRTKVILLGTGNPNPDPERAGCSVLILVNDTPYIIDFGVNGCPAVAYHLLQRSGQSGCR